MQSKDTTFYLIDNFFFKNQLKKLSEKSIAEKTMKTNGDRFRQYRLSTVLTILSASYPQWDMRSGTDPCLTK